MEPAPFHLDLAEGPTEVRAHWLSARDGVRTRAAIWPRAKAKGTVFLFPGRCEYVEKYGRTAAALADRGYASLAIDWRGQGMADRLLRNPEIGHVRRFTDYQKDVAALLALATAQEVPKPWYLLAHSMGGCIGLRTLTAAHPFVAAAFSAPMWGIVITPPNLKRAAQTLPILARSVGLGNLKTPTTAAASFFLETPFEGNFLTRDPDMWAYMVRQARADNRFRLGGPSLVWLAEALRETRALAALPRPTLPALAAVGTAEKIVEPATVPAIMESWQGGHAEVYEKAEHELLMEVPEIRDMFLQSICRLFDKASSSRDRASA